MSQCKKCAALNPERGTEPAWVLLSDSQSCIWESPTAIPEIETHESVFLQYFCSEQHILVAVEEYLRLAGATATWADVRPIEICAICGVDFDTTKPHQVLTVLHEEGDEFDPELIRASYAARFCRECAPKLRTPPDTLAG